MNSQEQSEISALYQNLLDCWNRHDAAEFVALFEEDGNQVGFDGSQVNGRSEIERHLSQIFADHMTAAYVGKVKEVRFLTADVAILRAVAGMIPHGGSDINPVFGIGSWLAWLANQVACRRLISKVCPSPPPKSFD